MEHTLKILAPAGDDAMLRAAVFSGADAVYLGVRGFNARRGAQNFEGGSLAGAVGFCHARGCLAYAAINTLVLPGREEAMYRAVESAADAGCDAVIAQDLAVAMAVREIAPHIPVHASTQMSVHSPAGAEKLAELGFARVILARELSEEEIAHIAARSPIELEVFVHGALCVSVSGQCYASAFLGGRSANRGGCAGPCRLPFAVALPADAPAAGARYAPAEDRHHLSLKDLSILSALPRLEAMGIAAAKIEGRLRGPEYCALAVDSARKALDREEYSRELLQNVFSRSGFTDGWFTGVNGGDMFGARTEADAGATRAALPAARELYRRERPRVPVQMALRFGLHGGALEVTDGANTVRRPFGGPLPPAEKDPAPALAAALAKTGGTPFYLPPGQPPVVESGGAFLPAATAGALRRAALEELLEIRQRPPAQGVCPRPAAFSMGLIGSGPGREYTRRAAENRAKTGRPLLRARFEHVAQLPQNAAELCDRLVLPLLEADAVPRQLREKTFLWLPRVLFGPDEERAAAEIARAGAMGFAGFEAQNIAHYALCRGQVISAGFGLNITNTASLMLAGAMGCAVATLSPELSLAQLRALCAGGGPHEAEQPAERAPCAGEGAGNGGEAAGTQNGGVRLNGLVATDAICYGHLPLMLTRACPVLGAAQSAGRGRAQHKGQCAACGACAGAGTPAARPALLADRTGRAFPLLCRDGARQLYNPVPLWMADRLAELPTGYATLYFTTESREKAAGVLEAFWAGRGAGEEFTRGLYDRGTED